MVASLAEAQSPNVPPETFLSHYHAIRDARRAHEDTAMALARVKKSAKGAGIDLDAFKLLEKLSKLDEDEAAIQLRHLRQYAEWAKLPLGTQLDAFGAHQVPKVKPKAASEHDLWAASDTGYRAGRAGRPREDNPHHQGTELYVNWTNGWLDGQRQIADEMADEEPPKAAMNGHEVIPPARRGRGRPPDGRDRHNGAGASAPS